MTSVEQLLYDHPFLSGLKPEHMKLLGEGASLQRYEEDEYLFHEHEDAEHFFLIMEGGVALKIQMPPLGPVPIETIHAGQALGWSWLVPPYKWHFDARAFSPVSAVVLKADRLRRLFDDMPELGYVMLQRINRVLAERLQATRLQLMDVYQATA